MAESKSMEIREVVELSPCPFCGGPVAMCVGENNFNDALVRCQNCMATGPNFDDHEDELDSVARMLNIDAATTAWNTRTPDHAAALKAAQDAIAVEKRALLRANAELAKDTERMRVMREALEKISDCGECSTCLEIAEAALASTAPVAEAGQKEGEQS